MTVFADPAAAVLAVLRSLHPDIQFGTRAIDDWPEGDVPELPYVQVRPGVAAVRWPVAAEVPTRVVVWGETEHATTALAWRLHAALLDYRRGPDVRSFRESLGPLPVDDPDTGRPLSSFTVLARLRPQQ